MLLAAHRAETFPAHEAGGSGYGGAVEKHGLVGQEHVDGAVGQSRACDEQQVAPVDGFPRCVAAFHEHSALDLSHIVRVEVDEPDLGFLVERFGECGLKTDDGDLAVTVLFADAVEYLRRAFLWAGVLAVNGAFGLSQGA